MIYLMSDVHGDYAHFLQMLKKIEFCQSDTLYLIGDVIDKNMENLKMLDFCMQNDNVILIKGNHERWMEKSFEEPDFILEWAKKGGKPTIEELEMISEEKKTAYYEYIKSLPFYEKIELNGTTYILTHTGYRFHTEPVLLEENLVDIEATICKMYDTDEYQYLGYSDIFALPEDITFDVHCFVGHVPTFWVSKDKSTKIMYTRNYTNIDCGAGHRDLGGKLACLRLDDRAEWYE